jgi:peptidoglycan/LPS O-acetylase OafA/YrhL
MSAPDVVVVPRTTEKAPSRIPALTGLRWWAALSVFFYHAISVPGLLPPTIFSKPVQSLFAPAGAVGVSFFFVLSGFVLTWSARPTDTAPAFWRRRFFRIYPNHWVCILVVLGLMLWTGNTMARHDIPQTVLLVQAWNPSFMASIGLNGVSWTLADEALFYLCFPLLIWLVRKIRPARLWYWAGAVVVAVFLIPLFARLFPSQPLMPLGPKVSESASWFVERFPVTRMFEFVLGILLARIVSEQRWIRLPLWAAWTAMVAGYAVATNTQGSLYGRVAVTIIPIGLLIAAAAQADIGGRGSFNSRPVLVWLGNISFAFYLLHDLVLGQVVYLYGPKFAWTLTSALGMVALALAVTVVLAWALHTFVEKPVYRRFAGASDSVLLDDAKSADVVAHSGR